MGLVVETTDLYAYHYRDTPEIVEWRNVSSEREVGIIVIRGRSPCPWRNWMGSQSPGADTGSSVAG